MTQIQTLLAANLKDARHRLGWSQMQLAERCGITTSFLGEIEIGRKFPSPKTLEAIADVLGLQPFQLFLDDKGWADVEEFKLLGGFAGMIKNRMGQVIDDAVAETLRRRDIPSD